MSQGIDTILLISNYQMLLYCPTHASKPRVLIRYAYFILRQEQLQLLPFERVNQLRLNNYYLIMGKSQQFQLCLVQTRYLSKLFLRLLFESVLLEILVHLMQRTNRQITYFDWAVAIVQNFHFCFSLGLFKSYFLLGLLNQEHGMFCLRIILINSIKSLILVSLFLI